MSVRILRMGTFCAALALTGLACSETPPGTTADPSAAAEAVTTAGDPRAGRVKSTTCTGCHGIPGYVNVYPTYHVPKVAGQHYEYLVAALESYRAGERDHPTMHVQSLSLSDQDIADIAAYFSSLGSGLNGRGKAVTGTNEQAQKLCASCHGKGGVSENPLYPILAGQYRDYLLRTLQDYQSGARQDLIMGGLVANLTEADLENLAAFYADQERLKTLEIAEQ